MRKDSLLIKSFNSGDTKSYRKIFQDLSTPLIMYACSLHNNSQEAEDVVQDAFVKLWEERENFDSIIVIKSYLFKVVRNAIFNIKKRENVIERHNPFIERDIEKEYDLENDIIREELYEQVFRVFEQLPSSCKKIYLMSLEGYKHQEISDKLNISVSTIKTQKNRANKFLKKKLKNLFTFLFSV